MEGKRPGRPLAPLNPDASAAARLGAELRARRLAQGLTLQALADLIDYSPQHVSEVERAKVTPSRPFVAACDHALDLPGALLVLLPAVLDERSRRCDDRAAARRAAAGSPIRCAAAHSEVGDRDVKPTNRRGLLGAGTAAALGGLDAAAAPAGARDVDPELPAHWTQLLGLLGRHNAMFGPQDVLPPLRRELRLIAEHRQIARGELRDQLLRVEARWTGFAAWLSNDTGRLSDRDALTDRALRLASETGYRDMVAFALMRKSQWAAQELDSHLAIRFAEGALRIRRTSRQVRARCELRAAFGHALANDVAACERSLAAAEGPLERAADPTFVAPWVGHASPRSHVRPDEARCWLHMQPSKAIGLYERVMRDWPREERAMGGLHQARLALACAAAGEHDRAQVEGRKALAVARTTKSGRAARELKRLHTMIGPAG